MYCLACGKEFVASETDRYCQNCLSEKEVLKTIVNYFNRGYPYGAIVGLLRATGIHMCVRTLKRRLRSLGLRRKGQAIDEQHLRSVIAEEIQGPGRQSGYRSIWHALRLRHGIHVSRHVVARIVKEIDPDGVEARKRRRLHRRVYRSAGANACWHIDGKLYI